MKFKIYLVKYLPIEISATSFAQAEAVAKTLHPDFELECPISLIGDDGKEYSEEEYLESKEQNF